MTDIALRMVSALGQPPRFDIAIENGDLALDEGLRTAVLLSLFLDRRAEKDDDFEGDDRRGSWQDQYLPHAGDRQGSRLHLLARAAESEQTLTLARTYASEALNWMVRDGIASKIETEATWVRPGLLGLLITITLANGDVWSETFNYPTG